MRVKLRSLKRQYARMGPSSIIFAGQLQGKLSLPSQVSLYTGQEGLGRYVASRPAVQVDRSMHGAKEPRLVNCRVDGERWLSRSLTDFSEMPVVVMH